MICSRIFLRNNMQFICEVTIRSPVSGINHMYQRTIHKILLVHKFCEWYCAKPSLVHLYLTRTLAQNQKRTTSKNSSNLLTNGSLLNSWKREMIINIDLISDSRNPLKVSTYHRQLNLILEYQHDQLDLIKWIQFFTFHSGDYSASVALEIELNK